MISVEHLSRRFGTLLAVDDIGFSIEKGEVVGFLGPNGAGKTTVMRILTGYLPATLGRAEVAGYDVLHQSMEVRRRIGYLPESVPLYGEHRVTEMLDFQGRLHGLSRAERRRRIPEALARVGLTDRSRQLVGTLSRGLRQRVGLAVALLPAPEVLILDEPTSGLDPLQRLEIRTLLRDLAAEHTVLISSHILPEIEAVCPRVIMLQRGRIAADGDKAELQRKLGGKSRACLELEAEDADHVRARVMALAGVDEATCTRLEDGWLRLELACEEDPRELLGGLAFAEGWRLRELSWRSQDLEQLFAAIALDYDDPRDAGAAAGVAGAEERTA